MPSSKTPLKVRLEPELCRQLHELHPGYGEASGIVAQLVSGYLTLRRYKIDRDQAVKMVVDGMKG
jgi:hypothetical protein